MCQIKGIYTRCMCGSTPTGDIGALLNNITYGHDIKASDTNSKRQPLCHVDDVHNDKLNDDNPVTSAAPWCSHDYNPDGWVVVGGNDPSEEPLALEGDPGVGEYHLGGSRRFSERLNDITITDNNLDVNTRSKKRRTKHKKKNKEGGVSCERRRSSNKSKSNKHKQQDDEEQPEEEQQTVLDDGGIDGDNKPSSDVDNDSNNKDSLSSLLDYNEPAVTYDGSRWPPTSSHSQDYSHRTAYIYSRYSGEDEPSNTSCTVAENEPRYRSNSDYNYRYEQRPISPPLSSTSNSSLLMKKITSRSATSALHKQISSLKRKIKKFEEEFERRCGYKPSHHDKMKDGDMKRYITELNKYRKEMKILKEGVADRLSSKAFPLSLLRCQESTSDCTPTAQDPTTNSSVEDDIIEPYVCTLEHQATLAKVQEKLNETRLQGAVRETDITKMSLYQLQEEKTCLQKALLYYESIHGRPNTRQTRELARPLYDRYRQVKRNVSRAQSRAKECTNELAPIIEHVQMDFTLASPQHRCSLTPDNTSAQQLILCQEKLANVVTAQPSDSSDCEQDDNNNSEEDNEDNNKAEEESSTTLSNLHSLPLHELKERRKEAKDQKKKLRRSLRQFEERYEKEHGQKLAKEDRGVMDAVYKDYKHAKAKLRLLEALISKKAPLDY